MLSEEKEEIWRQAREAIRAQITDHGYRMWIEPLEILGMDGNAVALKCPNHLTEKWVMEHYKELLEYHLQNALKNQVVLKMEVHPEIETKLLPEPEKRGQLPLPGLKLPVNHGVFLRKDYTFEEFVVGECNQYAHSAARSLASTRRTQDNCLYLISKTGLGKSHLSQAVGHRLLKQHPDYQVLYISAEDFTDEMVCAIKNSTTSRFKEKYRKNCDVLLLEGVHYLSGKQRTQMELAFILDYLMDAEKTLIFTSWYAPKDIPKLQESFRSRLTSGIVSEMASPDFKTRLKILKKKADGVPISQEVMEYLASELTEDVRQLVNGLNGVTTKSRILDAPINMRLAHDVVRNIASKKTAITLGIIKELVCRYYQVTPRDLISKSRKQRVVLPRQVAMYMGRLYTDQSLEAIARAFNRYHATVLYAINAVESHIRAKNDVSRQIEFLCKKIESRDFNIDMA